MQSIRLISVLLGIFLVISAPADAQSRKKRKKINAVIKEAKTYLGTPYRWGGQSYSGTDCSGLIFACYQRIDVTLPRTAKDQSKVGKSKGWGGLRKGDLVFFKFKEKGEKWYHSGIISEVDGDNIMFIHASSSRGVVESNLKSNYYKKNVKKFRRVI